MYAKVENGSVTAYPYNMGLLKKDHPHTSFPSDSFSRSDIKDLYGIVAVERSNPPSSKGYNVSENTPKFIDGVLTQSWDQSLKLPEDVDDNEKEGVDVPFQEGKVAVEVLPVWDGNQWNRGYEFRDATWLESRLEAYGNVREQIEFITENGLNAWQSKVAEIKEKYPKVG